MKEDLVDGMGAVSWKAYADIRDRQIDCLRAALEIIARKPITTRVGRIAWGALVGFDVRNADELGKLIKDYPDAPVQPPVSTPEPPEGESHETSLSREAN